MSQFQATTYDVQRPTGRCAFTDDVIEPGAAYYATLVELTAEELAAINAEAEAAGKPRNLLGLKRLDVAAPVWEGGQRPARLFSFWKTTQPEPNAKKKLFVDDTTLLALLRRLDGETDGDKQAFRYVLMLILMRKKLLRYDGLRVEGEGEEAVEYWELTPKLDPTKGHFGKWADETLSVLDPKLDESRIGEVTEQLGDVLEGDL